MTRRSSAMTAVALTIAAVGAAGAIVTPAAAAGLGTATPTPASIPNTKTAQTVTITNSVPIIGSAQIELVGPGTLKDTYTGTGTSSSGGSTTFNLDPAGLPAGPGTYTLNVCEASCPLTFDSGTITVTGAAPTPHARTTPFQVAPGGSVSGFALAGTGFAKDESISIPRPGGTASDVTFTENTDTSTATNLAGTLSVAASVPAGVYDLKVTDPAGQTGDCAGCLDVVSGTPVGPGPVVGLSATAATANAATATWKPPTSGTTPTSYKVVVSKTSTTTTDTGITVNVDQTNHDAVITGLTGPTTYYVTVTASDGTNTSRPAITQLSTPNPTALSLQASKTSIVEGFSVQLSGVLVHKVGSNPSSPMVGQSVIITGRSDHGTVTKIGTASTDTQGDFAFTAYPGTNTYFGAYFAGAPNGSGAPDSAAISNSFPRVTVSPLVVAAPRYSRIGKHTKTVQVLGFVTPKESGRTVELVRIDGTGKAHNIGHAVLTKSSHYAVRGRVPKHHGKYSFQVRISARVGNSAGKSRIFHVTRK